MIKTFDKYFDNEKLIDILKKVDNDYYYDDNKSDNYIEGTNYVIYGSDLDPLEDPFQDLLDFCN